MKLLRRHYEGLTSLGESDFISEDKSLGSYNPLTDQEIRYYPPRTLEELDKIEEKMIPPKIRC